MSVIILEGPDCSGKSTLAHELKAQIQGSQIVHPGKPPSSFPALMMLCASAITKASSDNLYICDRVTPISEMVYRPLRLGTDSMNHPYRIVPILMDAISRLIEQGAIFVYCRPPESALNSSEHAASEYDTADTLSVVRAHSAHILDTYDSLMHIIQHLGGQVLTYDYTASDGDVQIENLTLAITGDVE
ncbi:MAG: hypothetical protein LC687_04585 [Actinobacteria bacterium]|nr:hypothetical protein [Actinomycetota bacterium]MCA1807110.1 hypothetical protein [Actinomycetota bacterium]